MSKAASSKAARKTVFLVGEGKHDIGGLAYGPDLQTSEPGFLQPIVRKLATSSLSFEGQRLSVLPRSRIKRPRDILERRGRVAAQLASHQGADLLVMVTDVDTEPGTPGQKAAERRMQRLQHIISDGIEAADTGIPSVVGTPLRTIEAWALGDLEAVQHVARRRTPIKLAKAPEQLWGDPRDPSSNHPKQVLRRQFARNPGVTQYAAVATRADVVAIERSCPRSFAPFADAVRARI